ncbi:MULTISPECIES: TRAP transporter substrate-binding protein [unclassified Rhizobacter]|uniref:TRAP transporter substrate-binding protein n=1 Tax=unclassified Rhizobacter TaxID=2640088 RepID=UPI0006FD95F2|nr:MULTISPECIES: TRAP transporter substrate-binding protein [unclassified Rhizobacter]KQU76803.1 C4-dicarboxylate ABC transporter [Rhizobacter sp. Root29]KQV97323.1 C4-dicarboxylate ABC transporter [Rhizobacter sp. Root1238]KRB09995.1 C4-dicarboxylate ABC transporter [Rhizobacter sp. Root16D2]
MTQSAKLSITRRSALAAAALAVAAPKTFAQAPIVIKFSHVVAPDTPKGNGAQRFKELAEQRSGGRVKVDVYPNSQLYKDKEEMEALQLGSVQMLAPSLAKFGPLGVKEFEVFDLPFIFKDQAAFRAVTEGPVGADLFKKLEPKGVKGLAYWDNGFHIMSANKPLHKVADFKGLKMRIQSSKVLDAEMRALGAVPQVMAFSELYQALQSGVVDGCEGVPSNFYTQKTYEVQKHTTISNHGHLAYAVIVNKKFWDGLPADLRTLLEGALKEATAFANDMATKENIDDLEKMRASGKTTIYTPTAAELDEWKKALMPVHKEMASRVGQSTIDAVYKAAGFVPAK